MKRQSQGGSVIVWMMAMPNGLLSFKVMKGNMNSDGYINLLSESAVLTKKLNYRDNCWLQEDNSPVHKSKKVKEFMKISEISVLESPARSPDLNIIENLFLYTSLKILDMSLCLNFSFGPGFIFCCKFSIYKYASIDEWCLCRLSEIFRFDHPRELNAMI